jgi:hypothetical protein
MANLVYISSGSYNPDYENLPFDKIYLVDLKYSGKSTEKVQGLKMDALESLKFFKENHIQIDCLVLLRESQGEGGYTYNMCSDMVIGYFMSILPKTFILICNDVCYYDFRQNEKSKIPYYKDDVKFKKYETPNLVSLDLPYKMTQLFPGDSGYIEPTTFTEYLAGGPMHVYQMELQTQEEEYTIGKSLKIRCIKDSIWSHEDELDKLYISFYPKHQAYKDHFANNHSKAQYYKQMDFGQMLIEAHEHGYKHIGFTPHYWYQYDRNYQKMLEAFCLEKDPEMTIDFYYLNSWFKYRHIIKAVKTILRAKRSRYKTQL